MILAITEEYGFREWIAELDKAEYDELLAKWQTLRGLSCCVPVKFIIPQARVLGEFEKLPSKYVHCHIHESDDSYLGGCNYEIPNDNLFWCEGKSYTSEEVYAMIDDERYMPNHFF